jgi:hypothetical protein
MLIVRASRLLTLLWVALCFWTPVVNAEEPAGSDGVDAASEEPTLAEPAAAEAAMAEPSLEERVRAILDSPAEGEGEGERGEIERCINTIEYQSVEILDSEHLVFKGRGDKRWLNQLRMKCPGLRRHDTLSFEIRSNRLCEFDSFRSVDLTGYRGATSPRCSLGRFEPVSPDQVQMLKDALRAARSARRSPG